MCSPPQMANHHLKLAAIAKTISYRKGELALLEKRERELLQALKEVQREKANVEQSIQQLNTLIEAFNLDPDEVRGIRPTPRKAGSAYGTFRGTLVKILMEAGGPITTTQIFELLRGLNDSQIKLPESKQDALEKIARDIRTMSSYGVVIRSDSRGAGKPATSDKLTHAPLHAKGTTA